MERGHEKAAGQELRLPAQTPGEAVGVRMRPNGSDSTCPKEEGRKIRGAVRDLRG